jgi:glycosyltransferase involved in cell wall biosynthesis
MRIGLYDPYLDTLGGGERYVLSAAACLSKSHQVELFWDEQDILKKAEKKLNLDLSKVTIKKNIFTPALSFHKRLIATRNYDVIIFLSDGSIPWSLAKKNILLFQFPVNWVKLSLSTKAKLTRVHKIICYTDFVKQYLDKTFHTSSQILFPPVKNMFDASVKKENLILSVGRFTKGMNAKKQDVLISAFKTMHDKGLKDWKLIVGGSYLPEDKDFVEVLEKSSVGYPIEIAANVPYAKLVSYYQKAKIYWHAAGYGEDLEKFPERAEHFGITTVEAMGAGAVPIVINGGGQKEIVTEEKDGLLWDTLEELTEKTGQLIKDKTRWEKLSAQARLRAGDFSLDNFSSRLEQIVQT